MRCGDPGGVSNPDGDGGKVTMGCVRGAFASALRLVVLAGAGRERFAALLKSFLYFKCLIQVSFCKRSLLPQVSHEVLHGLSNSLEENNLRISI